MHENQLVLYVYVYVYDHRIVQQKIAGLIHPFRGTENEIIFFVNF